MEIPPPTGAPPRADAADDGPPDSRVTAEWGRRVQAEYRSAATAARLVHLAIACGLPPALLTTGLRVVQDELDHARLSQQTRLALGGADRPLDLDLADLVSPPGRDGPLAELVDLAARDFCLGESFAVPLFRAMRAGTTHPVARATLDRVLQDEAVHRQLGWDCLDALLLLDADGVRTRVQASLPGWLAAFRAAYAHPDLDAATPLTPDERAAGLLDPQRYRHLHDRCLTTDIGPRLVARGLHLPRE